MTDTLGTTPAEREARPALGRPLKIAILVCMNAIYFFAFFHRVAVPGTVFDELQAEFRAPASAIANLGAIYLYIYAGMQLFAGMMSDRLGPLRVLVMGGVVFSVGAVVFPLASSLPLLYASRALIGLGASFIYLGVVKGCDVLFHPRRFPELLGITLFLGYSGGLVGTFPLERAVSAWGWRPPLLAAGVLGALAVAGAGALFRKARPADPSGAGLPLVIGAVLRNRHTWPLLIACSVNFGVYFLMQATLGKKFLLDYGHLSSPLAALFTFLMMAVTMCLGLAGGFLARVVGNRRKPLVVTSVFLTVASVGYLRLAMALNLSGGWLLAGFLLMAATAVGTPSAVSLMKELNRPEAVGTTAGVLNAASYLAVAILVTIAGGMMDHYQGRAVHTGTAVIYPAEAYAAVLTFCLVVGTVALVASFCLRETHGKMVA